MIGFCYHMVSDARPAHTAHLGPHKSAAQFEADLVWLGQHYRLIGYSELCKLRGAGSTEQGARSREHGARLTAVLTFDDGLREHLTVVKPLLARYEIPGIFFVTTDFIDNRAMFYRHKVSLCIESLQGRSEAELRQLLVQLGAKSEERRAESGEASSTRFEIRSGTSISSQLSALSSQPSASCSVLPALCSRLKSLTQLDEQLIDEVCQLLGVDWRLYLRDVRPYLTREEIKSLAAEGFTIGAHGKSHVRLRDLESRERRVESREPGAESGEQRAKGGDRKAERSSAQPSALSARPPALSPPLSALRSPLSTLDSELSDSCRMIADLTGADSVPFAFPFSGDGVSRQELAVTRSERAEVGLIFDRRGFRQDAPFVVQRIVADEPLCDGGSNLLRLVRREYRRQVGGNVRESVINQTKA